MAKLYTIIRRFLFELGRYDITGWKLSRSNKFIIRFVYLVLAKTEKILQFWNKKFSETEESVVWGQTDSDGFVHASPPCLQGP